MKEEEYIKLVSKLIEDVEEISAKVGTSILGQGRIEELCRPYANEFATKALEEEEFVIGDAKRTLSKAKGQAAMRFIHENTWNPTISMTFDSLKTLWEYILKSGGGGWEKKVFTLCHEMKTDENWPGRFGAFVTSHRTTTHYGFRFPGKQGPHTIARILGVKSRIRGVQRYIKRNKPTFPREFNTKSCSSEQAVNAVHAMYLPYLTISEEVSRYYFSSLPDYTIVNNYEVKLGSRKLCYEQAQAHFAVSKEGKGKFKSLDMWRYDPGRHALAAYGFYRSYYNHARTRNDLYLMMAFGQILADLHPLATVTTVLLASFQDTQGGGEAGSMNQLEKAVETNDLTNAFKAIMPSNSKGKGLIDKTSTKEWNNSMQGLFWKYARRVLVRILVNYGFTKYDVEHATDRQLRQVWPVRM